MCVNTARHFSLTKMFFSYATRAEAKGIGFYENEGFYPNFILWILEGAKQRIVFIEPHGMTHEAIHEYNEKIKALQNVENPL